MAKPGVSTDFSKFTSSRRCYGRARTQHEMEAFLRDIQKRPREWAVYSLHGNVRAANVRAHNLRKRNVPKAFQPVMDHLRITATVTDDFGPAVLVRWIP